MLDAKDVLVEYGVREEMRSRGWHHAWDQGRWPGSRDRGLDGYPERVSAGLVAQVVAACWHTSHPAIERLRAWRELHPSITPPRYQLDHEGRRQLTGPLAQYMRLANQVTTTVTSWRAGITQAHTLIPHQPTPP
ncbi:hypothetical protein [Streptomyces sp. NPDC054765]